MTGGNRDLQLRMLSSILNHPFIKKLYLNEESRPDKLPLNIFDALTKGTPEPSDVL
jgi:hypothetical protein